MKKLIFSVLLIAAMAAAVYITTPRTSIDPTPVEAASACVTIETPEKKSRSDRESFTVDVLLSALEDDDFPAASFSLGFDSSKLEFIGLEDGNVMISCEDADGNAGAEIPDWDVNVEVSNEKGRINIMYLDRSGGNRVFSRSVLPDGEKLLFKLRFALSDGAQSGDIYELDMEDAVFAASEESRSLSSVNGTLSTRNGRIVVGD